MHGVAKSHVIADVSIQTDGEGEQPVGLKEYILSHREEVVAIPSTSYSSRCSASSPPLPVLPLSPPLDNIAPPRPSLLTNPCGGVAVSAEVRVWGRERQF